VHKSNLAKNIGITFLTFLIFFLSTGIHDLTHTPAIAQHLANPLEVRSGTSTGQPDGVQCNACFFNQILNQCLFPVFEQPFVAESFTSRSILPPGVVESLALGNTDSRGPPLLSALS